MPQLTDQQLAQLAAGAGWSGPDLDTAIAVALAESGGNSDNIGDVGLQNATFGPSVGLWQIRSVNPGYGNAFDQAHRNEQANVDPSTNAANAYAIQQHYGWGQWSTYTGGQYRQFLDRARASHSGDTTTPTDQLQQTPQQQGQQSGQGSNSQGFLGELEKLIESAGKLMNPADKLTKAAQAASRAAASGQAFGKVNGSNQAHQAHVSNTQKYSRHAGKGSERVKTHSDDIKSSASDYQNFSDQGARSIDQTTQPVREDMINPPIPSNVA